MLVNVLGLPGVADPDVADGAGGAVAARGDHVLGDGALLGLVLVLCGGQHLCIFDDLGKRENARGAQRC